MDPIRFHGLDIQSRDLAILSEISASSFGTRQQVAASCFKGSYEAAKKRLRALIQSGLISTKQGSRFSPAVLRLTKDGASLLAKQAKAQAFPTSPRQIASVQIEVREHELWIRDVRSALVGKIRAEPGLAILSFDMSRITTAFSVYCGEHQKTETVRPDALMLIRQELGSASIEQSFYLEIDRSTETQIRLSHGAALYLNHFRLGGFARKRGASPLNRSDHSMRVLLIFESEVRLENTARRLIAQTQIKTLVWLATKADVLADPFGAVWSCPADFGPGKIVKKRKLFPKRSE